MRSTRGERQTHILSSDGYELEFSSKNHTYSDSFCFSQFLHDSNLKENVLHCQFIQKMAHFFWLTSSPRLTRHPDDESPVLGSTGGIYKVLTFPKGRQRITAKYFIFKQFFNLICKLLTLTCSTLRGLLQPTLRSSCKNAYKNV